MYHDDLARMSFLNIANSYYLKIILTKIEEYLNLKEGFINVIVEIQL